MTEKTIKFRDPVVERVVDKFVSRSDVGFEKYGQTLVSFLFLVVLFEFEHF